MRWAHLPPGRESGRYHCDLGLHTVYHGLGRYHLAQWVYLLPPGRLGATIVIWVRPLGARVLRFGSSLGVVHGGALTLGWVL